MPVEDSLRAKQIVPDHDIHELVRRRWSPRSFDARGVDRETVLRLLEAARWAPSSGNEQPWRFVVGERDDPESFERLLSCLNASNALWAQHAQVLLLSVANTRHHNEKPNRHAFHDLGLATANLLLQATALGLFVHPMAGFDVERARQVCAVPEGFEPATMFAAGHLGAPEMLNERLMQRELAPRSRRPVEEFAFRGKFGESLENR
jgi:nitroreductase